LKVQGAFLNFCRGETEAGSAEKRNRSRIYDEMRLRLFFGFFERCSSIFGFRSVNLTASAGSISESVPDLYKFSPIWVIVEMKLFVYSDEFNILLFSKLQPAKVKIKPSQGRRKDGT
jgi:hypothetical protein